MVVARKISIFWLLDFVYATRDWSVVSNMILCNDERPTQQLNRLNITTRTINNTNQQRKGTVVKAAFNNVAAANASQILKLILQNGEGYDSYKRESSITGRR